MKVTNRIILIFLGYILLNGQVLGFLSMDTLVQRLTQISTSKKIEESGTSQGGKDIFMTTLANINASEGGASLHSISNIKTGIEKNAQLSNYSCSINNNDILTVLLSIPEFTVEFYKDSNISLSQGISDFDKTNDELTNSCQKILKCIGTLQSNKIINSPAIQNNSCQKILHESYKNNKILESSFSNIPLANNNDNIYMDKIKENGLFDIMIDIENIKDILFDPGNKGPEFPQIIYYSLPTVTNPGSTNPGSTNPGSTNPGSTNPGSTNPGSTNPGSTNQVGSQIDNFIANNTTIENSNIKNQGNNTTSIISSQICLPEKTYNGIDGINNSGNISGGYNLGSGDTITDYNTMQNEVLDALSGYIYNPRSAGGGGNTNIGGNFIQMSGAMPSTTAACSESCSNTEGTEKLICEGKCCIKSCEQISNLADRAVCLSQCLCGEISVANDILRIKICRVPAQASQVIAGKKISSIEQAVDEINQVFLKLKQNGALIKRTKTQEFLDSSFSSIKFHKILAFDIFVAIKPIYDILQVDQVKKNSKDDEQLLSTINGTTGQRGKGKDRIKYASSGLNGTLEENNNLCAGYGTTYDRTTKNCRWGLKNEAIVSALGQSQSVNKRNDMIAGFLNEHYSFWDEVYNHIVEIQLTTENLKMKAEDSK